MGEDAAGYPLKPPAPRSFPPTSTCGASDGALYPVAVPRLQPAPRSLRRPPATVSRSTRGFGRPRIPPQCSAGPPNVVFWPLRPTRLPAPVMAAVHRCPRGCPCWPSSGLRNLGNMCNPELHKGRLQSNKVVKTSKAPAKVPPKEPIFTCSVCWNKLEEPATTTCGHIFCKNCIKQAIQVQKKFPTCRKYLKMNNFHRIYFPNTAR